MWSKLKSSLANKFSSLMNMPRGGAATSEEQLRGANSVRSSVRSTLNDVDEEYRKALRTKSYVDIWTKIHRRHLRRTTSPPPAPPAVRRKPPPPSSSPAEDDSTLITLTTPTCSPLSLTSPLSYSYSHLSECLLELEPHSKEALLVTIRNHPDLHALFLDYFETGLEACNICGSLLGSIDRLRRNHRTLCRLLNRITTTTTTAVDYCSELASYVELENPLSSLKTVQFLRIHDLYDSLIRRLMLARGKIMRRARLLRLVKRVSGVTLVAVCGALVVAALVVAAHAVVVLAVASGPALVAPAATWVRRRVGPVRSGRLARLWAQVDAAARGAYIMSQDMETMSRMVTRLHGEVEHGKDVVRMFLRSRERWVLRELVVEGGGGRGAEGGRGGGGGFVEQLDEMEEHVYWCLLTINRTRRLVAQEICGDTGQSPAPTMVCER